MGSWGIKALESDNGLDVIDLLRDYIEENYPDIENSISFNLKELIDIFINQGLLANSLDNIDYLYDNSLIALSELYIMFRLTGVISYEDDRDIRNLEKRVKAFDADIESLNYLLNGLTNIKNEVPDEDGIREYVECWKDSSDFSERQSHIKKLTLDIELEKSKL